MPSETCACIALIILSLSIFVINLGNFNKIYQNPRLNIIRIRITLNYVFYRSSHLKLRASSSITVRMTSRSVRSATLVPCRWSALNSLTKLFSERNKEQN